ncbi:MAG: hypothetical protein LBM75_05235 [Myxococcales bacterium]|nr:hypothetical protein [Myxococcales bacterium]
MTTTLCTWKAASPLFVKARLCLFALIAASFLPLACGESELKVIGFSGDWSHTPSPNDPGDADASQSQEQRCTADLCGAHGTCDDSTDKPLCSCEQGYIGVRCSICAVGYVSDGFGNCHEDAGQVDEPDAGSPPATCATAGLSCGNGDCSDASGTPKCVCSTGYTGSSCNQCAAGYSGYPNCSATPTCNAATTCSGHGSCNASGGCSCSTGYTGSSCNQCAAGYSG